MSFLKFIQLQLRMVEVCMLISYRLYSAKEAVAAMIKRMAHRNANVQLYTLEVRKILFYALLVQWVAWFLSF